MIFLQWMNIIKKSQGKKEAKYIKEGDWNIKYMLLIPKHMLEACSKFSAKLLSSQCKQEKLSLCLFIVHLR